MLNETERRVLDAIDRDGLVATLQRLIACPSLGGSDAEQEVQRIAAAEMAVQGLTVDVADIDIAALEGHVGFPGQEVARSAAVAVQGTYTGGNGPRLILNGHLDVVPVGDPAAWHDDPWGGSVRRGRVFGRGACDMKGGVATIIHAAGAIIRSGVRLRGALAVQTVIGEEDGGLGSFDAALRHHPADGAIITEPTGLRPVLAQAGCLTFRLTVTGRAAHGALRAEGISALDAYLPLHHALKQLEQQRNQHVAHPLMAALALPYPISVGIIQAGDWASTVPETLVAEGRYGVLVGESPEGARTVLAAAIQQAVEADPWLREHPPVLEWWGGIFESAEIDAAHPLVQTLNAALADEGHTPQLLGVPYGSDMRLLQRVGGTPTLLFGAGDPRLAHQRDESIAIDELVVACRAVALAALRFCGYDEAA